MKPVIVLLSCLLLSSSLVCEAKGGFSSGGGGRGSFSSGGSRSYSSSYKSSPSVSRSTTTTTRTYSSNRTYATNNYYGGMGMGYGYSNGLLTGMIIGNMMHPTGTVMYVGPGAYSNNALLYPDGRVVDNTGHLVGNYAGNNFTPVPNGGMVAQAIPSDATPQPVVVKDNTGEVVLIAIMSLMFILLIIGMLL